jgi:hypothetical protein
MKSPLRFVLLATLIASASLLSAGTLGVTTSNTGTLGVNTGTWTLGYSFLVNSAITVNGLGVFDDGSDGLNVSHDVGLWDAAGNLLASTTVAAGTVAPLNGFYRMATISGVSLTAGNVYYVGSVNGIDNDGWLQDPTTLVAAPEITYLSRQYEFSGGGLVFPDLAGSGTTGYFGGNFEFGGSPVPEPGSLLMLGSGVLAAAGALRRKFRS